MTPADSNIDAVLREGEVYYDEEIDTVIRALDVTDNYLEVGVGKGFSCGNEVIEPWEDCENTNLNQETCESLGYREGSLSCLNCQYDLTQCSDPICGEGHIFNGINSCTAEIIAELQDNNIWVFTSNSWDELRHL